MNKPLVYFIEPFMTGHMHAAFNAAMLQVFATLYPEMKINFYAAADHQEAVSQHKSLPLQIKTYDISVLQQKAGNKIWWLFKHLLEYYVITQLLIKASIQKPHLIYFSFLSPPAQWLVSIYSKYLFKSAPLLIQLHGLEILKARQDQKKIDKLYVKFLSKAFRLKARHKRYLVMEKGAKDYLHKKQYLQQTELLYLPHPYLFNKAAVKLNNAYPLVFAHLGVARLSKQSHLFFQLAADMFKLIEAKKVKFKVIGQVLPEMKPYLNDWVEIEGGEEMLSHDAYHTTCSDIHYAVFCYSADSYELTTSGAVIDAIAAKKPILALKNKSFQHLFSIPSTEPGKLFSSMQEMKEEILNIIYQDGKSIPYYDQAFIDLQEHYSIENVAMKLKQGI